MNDCPRVVVVALVAFFFFRDCASLSIRATFPKVTSALATLKYL